MTDQIKFYTHGNKPGVDARFEIISQITLLHGSWDHTSRGQIIKSVNRGGALAVVWDSGRSGQGFPTTPTTRECWIRFRCGNRHGCRNQSRCSVRPVGNFER